MSDQERLARARSVVEANLLRGERVETALLASWRPPASGLSPLARAREFLGAVGPQQPVVLTSARVLLMPNRGRGAGGWFDAQYDRRRVAASRPVADGEVLRVEVTTGLGLQVLRAPAARRDEVEDFCLRLGYRHL